MIDRPDEEPGNGQVDPITEYAEVTPSMIDQPEEESCNGPVEPVVGESVVAPVKVVVEQRDEAVDVTPARGPEVRNSFGDLVGWLDPGAKPMVLAPPRTRKTVFASAAWRGIRKAVRVLCCCSRK